ncbi:MAG TPA: 2-hydroxycarboxylate transporter family protein [Steroidobacteraceae bacterium]|nr:2-hydroxycarboxylate transporter family protein [Steroidobacteraceae bacterium]
MNDATGYWPKAWWKVMEMRIGIIPLPVYLTLLVLVAYFVASGRIPTEINMMIALLAVLGFTCAELGHRLPLLNQIGGAAIFATFLPSFLNYHHWIPAQVAQAVTDFTRSTNFLYLFIAAVVVGSIFSMDRRTLLRGFVRLFVPMAVGSVAALLVGTAVGAGLGLGVRHTLLMIVIPVMAGGVGEGAIPLSVGYAQLWHQEPGELFAQVLPPVMFGSLTAILLAGMLSFLGRRFPHLTGEGRLQPQESEQLATHEADSPVGLDVTHIAAAGLLIITLYLLGLVCFQTFRLPAPVSMLLLAVLLKLIQAVPPSLQQGAYVVYQFFRRAVTYPLLFAIGVALTPWDRLMGAFAPRNLLTIIATVLTLVTTGFVVGRWIRLFPIDTAIVIACRAGQGGTGDVAILTAANRMQLMPFAQIATRIGGAITVTLTLLALAHQA